MKIYTAPLMTREEIEKAEIVEVTTRYVVSDQERLVSPAGHHYSDNYRVKTEIMVFFDERPTPASIPAIYKNGIRQNVFLHDLHNGC